MPKGISRQPDYDAWLQRLAATHDAVVYTCAYRLGDRDAAAQIGVQVIGGMLARPGVFRYSGLPYSGAIARLAEGRIDAARDGRLPAACSWQQLYDALVTLPDAHQQVLVLTCVHGYDDERVAAELECSAETAAMLREKTRSLLRALAADANPPLNEAG